MSINREYKSMDGNTAAAHVAYAFTEASCIYPITPSSPMAESMDEWVTKGRENLFGETVNIVEMESEAGAAGAFHGALATGALATTFTASQGLLLMIPNLYKVAGERLPGVLHVAARAIASHSLSIYGDHSDVMACRQTGVCMLVSNDPQEIMDLAPVAHLAAMKGRLPFIHFFDGFRTSHEIKKLQVWDYKDLNDMLDMEAIETFRQSANNPNHPFQRGASEPPEIFFQHREACNKSYEDMVEVVEEYMTQINNKLGTDYKPFNYYGDREATDVIVAMGSVCGAIEDTIDYLNSKGQKTGLLMVHLYRPFSVEKMMDVLPKTVKRIAVLDRTKEPGSLGEPLFLDICAAISESGLEGVTVIGGRYGISSKDVTSDDMAAVYANLASKCPKKHFTVGINDDVTGLSLRTIKGTIPPDESCYSIKFWGIGSDGLVGANKNTIKIIGDHTDKNVQAYFQYDSKKSGGLTVSHLRFGDRPIRNSSYVNDADFVCCGKDVYMGRYEMVRDVKPGGIFLLNCTWSGEELSDRLPANVKRDIACKNIAFYTIDAVDLAKELGLKGRINTIIQAAFFKLTQIIPIEDAVHYMKDSIAKTYGKKGEKVVAMNCAAVDAGLTAYKRVEVPKDWINATDRKQTELKYKPLNDEQSDYIHKVMIPTNNLLGDEIPVSVFLNTSDGRIPSGTSAYEKRGIAVDVPVWNPTECMQCNWCSTVCPHAVIRPFVLSKEAATSIGATTIEKKGSDDKHFLIGISAEDCTGCGACAEMCPARNKALTMQRATQHMSEEQHIFEKAKELSIKNWGSDQSITESQFLKPYLEYSGACPGCGETPYAKLVTQLFGDHAYIANATGCSSIWGCSAPSTPYTLDENGHGPAWANSLFEDNAEFGYGMNLSVKTRRNELKTAVIRLQEREELREAANEWLSVMNTNDSKQAGQKLLEKCKQSDLKDAEYIIKNADLLTKPSMWIFGGDGWAYDIGYGGLDHILASGENINVLVFDTEVYSNTGGQSSKSTPTGAVAQFASNGKVTGKKDLAQMIMTYGHVYVATVAIGANPAQTLKAFKEAESYDGPSLIICYAPCINHGVKAGMNNAMPEMKKAVRAGYWNLLRFDPRKKLEGLNPLSIDSASPSEDYKTFLRGEVRYASLELKNPERANQLFLESEKMALSRYNSLLQKKDSLEPEGGEQR